MSSYAWQSHPMMITESFGGLWTRSWPATNSLCYAAQNLVEFWNVCTRPVLSNGFGLSTSETEDRAKLIEAGFRFLPDGERVHSEWSRLVVEHSVAGVQVHDARLVASMLIHGIEHILTLNDRDFGRYSRISAVHPRQLL
jgi:predicted nucleic acid-binding protein